MSSLNSINFAGYLTSTLLLASSTFANTPGCAIALDDWELQLPVGSPDGPATIPAQELVGCNGFQGRFSILLDE